MVSSNLPVRLTTFIGREQELAEVKRLVAMSRLMTLTGTAGCGKSRLALHVAGDVSSQYQDGVYWVELARLTDATLVVQAVARAVNVVEQPGRSLIDGLLAVLGDKHLLLVLDNCEHLLSACAQLVESLLTLPDLHILTTSRTPIGVTGEMLYPVLPLALPPVTLLSNELHQYDAIRLFVDRARATLPKFELTPENAPIVATICHHLDGIPLAIELASARVNVLTVSEIAARLNDRFALLAAATHLIHSHHRTLHAALDWSYDLLSPQERILLQRLAVFAGGFTLETAESVCVGGAIERGQLLDLLSSLVDKSLVMAETLIGTQARYRLLESIHEYAQEKLRASGETALLRDRHLALFVTHAEEIEPKLRSAYEQLWANWLESELANLRAALQWSLESGRIAAGLRLANAISEFWWFYGYQSEGRAWFERLLAEANEDVPLLLRAQASSIVTHFSWQMGDHDASEAQAKAAIALTEAAGEEGNFFYAFAMMSLANNLRVKGEYEAAFDMGQQSVELMRKVGYGLAEPLSIQGINAIALGEYELGRNLLTEALSSIREQGNTHRVASILKILGDLARAEGDYADAQSLYEESLSIYRELDTPSDMASVLCSLAHTKLHLGKSERGYEFLNESLSLQRAAGNERGKAECLLGFGALAIGRGLPVQGVRLLTAAVTWAAESLLNTYPGERVTYEKSLAAAQTALTERAFTEAQREGRTLTIEQAIELALSMPLSADATQAENHERVHPLTPREREVAALIAQGRSNGEIAAELVLSKRTVEKHIANILGKLTLTNRSQIVRWAIENGLTHTHIPV